MSDALECMCKLLAMKLFLSLGRIVRVCVYYNLHSSIQSD